MTDQMVLDQLRCALIQKPRLPLASLPTPLEEAPRLSQRLGVRVLIKRDDQTGLALGGNKARKLEFLIADALACESDTVITTGGSQSNHARITAAACRRAQLECYLVLDRGLHPEPQGNLLLDELLVAHVELIDSQDPAVARVRMETLDEQLRERGRRPYVIPRGGSIPQGATGYAAFIPELLEQLDALGTAPSHLYLATGSAGTHAGVLAGIAATTMSVRAQGISVSGTQEVQTNKVLDLSNRTLAHLGLEQSITAEHVHIDDRFVGAGYGHLTPEAIEAIQVLAEDEGIFLDPVYTGKAMAGLIAHAREGRFGPSDTIVFIHTGGTPAIFAYNIELSEALHSRPR